MAASYYRGALGALIVYDLTKYENFENVNKVWLKEVKNFAAENIKIMMIGNKCDK